MGLLDKLWDDTLAGPRPDSGLGRLRKPLSFSLRTAAKDESESPKGGWTNAAGGDGPAEETPMRVTRSIMIKRPPGWASPGSGATPPTSPAGSTTPKSPFSGTFSDLGFPAVSALEGRRGIDSVGGGCRKRTGGKGRRRRRLGLLLHILPSKAKLCRIIFTDFVISPDSVLSDLSAKFGQGR
ncbi:hypothetical protein ZIOFF_055272 [Zingiber officinale]|uniref:Uncharacterized protein n=1 Tax=Zingiber officinale TaxID=94328 RepID=A0A8J5KK64_ZINOF|nr:hypothetical protein ZIOFF_055272 [Zingiber officinale]